jgi:tetratricopeptide (TPR) repeat protein
MPVLYTAACRRLGYPVFLVEAKDHLYCRWDDVRREFSPRERFNIEGSSQGFSTPPDSFYLGWPRELTDFDRESGAYGRCLSPREELACFLTTRGHCLLDNGRRDEAIECFRWSVELAPNDKRYELQLNSIVNPINLGYYVPPRNPYPAGTVVEVPYGSQPPADLPWGVPVKYVAASGGGGLPGRQPMPGRPVKVAAGRPLPTCLPPGTPMQVVPADQADDLSVFEAAAKRPQALTQFARPEPVANHGRPGISGPQRGPLPGLPGY